MTPAITPKKPATANSAANLLATKLKLKLFNFIICIAVRAKTMHSTSVIADSKVNIEYVYFFILRFWIIGITKAEEMPPKINPINNECSKSKPKSIDINAIAIEEMKKLYNVISIPLPSPFTKEIRSILKFILPSSLEKIAPFFTTFALLFLLFDGAFNIDLISFVKGLGRGMLITLYNFFISSIAIALISMLFGFDLLHSLLIGFILGGVSSAFVIPIIQNLRIKKETYSILTLES